MKTKKYLVFTSLIFSVAKYGLIFTLFYLNRHYYYSLNLMFNLKNTYFYFGICVFLSIVSTNYLYNLKKSSNLYSTINYYFISFISISYTILLIDFELILASLVTILYIAYLYIEALVDNVHLHANYIFSSLTFLIISLVYTISNFCIVLLNM